MSKTFRLMRLTLSKPNLYNARLNKRSLTNIAAFYI